jgi:thioredoxin 1
MGGDGSGEQSAKESAGYATAQSAERSPEQTTGTSAKPLDRWLGIAGIVLGIILYLVPKTPALVVVLLLLMLGLLIHPIWNFWWIERSTLRRSITLVTLVLGTIIFGIWVWPPASESPVTKTVPTSDGPSPPKSGSTPVPTPQPAGAVRHILESDFSKEVLQAKLPTLVFFCTTGNDACDVTQPAVSLIARRFAGQVQVVELDVYVNQNIAGDYDAGYFEVPVLSLFKSGVEQGRLKGAASEDAIAQLIASPRKFRDLVPKQQEASTNATAQQGHRQTSDSPDASKTSPEANAAPNASAKQSPAAADKSNQREADKDAFASIPTVAESDFDDAIKKSDTPVLVYFYATWSDACKEVTPVVVKVAQKREADTSVIRIDSSVHKNVAAKYDAGPFETPVFILFKGGSARGRIKGTASLETIDRLIDHPEQFHSQQADEAKKDLNIAEILAGIPSVLDSDFDSEVKLTTPTLVFFYDEYDRTSKATAPTVAEISALYKNKIKVIRVDTSINRTTEYRYYGASLVLFLDGKVKGRINGAFSKDAVSKMIDKVLPSK